MFSVGAHGCKFNGKHAAFVTVQIRLQTAGQIIPAGSAALPFAIKRAGMLAHSQSLNLTFIALQSLIQISIQTLPVL